MYYNIITSTLKYFCNSHFGGQPPNLIPANISGYVM